MDGRLHSVWLSLLLDAGSSSLNKLYAYYGGASEMLYERKTPEFTSLLSSAAAARNTDDLPVVADRILDRCDRAGISVIGYEDARYPHMLRDTDCPPAVLYVTGDAEALVSECISGVGTRNITAYGRAAVNAICSPLTGKGYTLVSGMAHGVDSEVHKAALKSGGRTIAVLGTAIDRTYPAVNALLRREIEANGAVISEYAPDTETNANVSFPLRNRIIAGMSAATIIFEAAMKSGTMITANYALEYSREVLCVPGSILSEQSEGTNYLIKQGATPVANASDVLEAIGASADIQNHERNAPPKLTGDCAAVYEAVASGIITEDGIAEATGLPVAAVRTAVSELEIDGILLNAAGQIKILK